MSDPERAAKAAHNRTVPSAKTIDLKKPEKVSTFTKDAKYQCFSCKIWGAGSLFALAFYVYISGKYNIVKKSKEIIKRTGNPSSVRNRMMAMRAMSASLAGAGVYRAMN